MFSVDSDRWAYVNKLVVDADLTAPVESTPPLGLARRESRIQVACFISLQYIQYILRCGLVWTVLLIAVAII
jgi:hypothetical protein